MSTQIHPSAAQAEQHKKKARPMFLWGAGLFSFVLIVAVGLGAFFSSLPGTGNAQAEANPIVGAWAVSAIGAPFEPHVAVFHADFTMEIDNPEAGDPHTSDSVGYGAWRVDGTNGHLIIGMFREDNADRATGKYVSYLIVTFTLLVQGDTFSSPSTRPAEAIYYNPDGTVQPGGPYPATLIGTRLHP